MDSILFIAVKRHNIITAGYTDVLAVIYRGRFERMAIGKDLTKVLAGVGLVGVAGIAISSAIKAGKDQEDALELGEGENTSLGGQSSVADEIEAERKMGDTVMGDENTRDENTEPNRKQPIAPKKNKIILVSNPQEGRRIVSRPIRPLTPPSPTPALRPIRPLTSPTPVPFYNRYADDEDYDEGVDGEYGFDEYREDGHEEDEYIEDEYEEDEYGEDEHDDEEIDNTGLNYSRRDICIRLNDDFSERERRNRLRTSENVLCKRFPKLKEIPSDDRLQKVLDGVFSEGFNKQMYIRNLTFTNQTNGWEVRVLGIRPQRTPGDYLDNYLPEGVSLIFKGHLAGKQFTVDSIHETADTERLDFEVDCVATPYKDPARIRGGNFLYDVLEEAGSLTEYTSKRLEEWKDYLSWKKNLAQRQIKGCKYYRVTFDKDRKKLVFWLVCPNEEYFQEFRKYLYRDIQVFDNNYSSNEWIFEFPREVSGRRQRYNSVEVGRCRGVVSEYYLKEVDSVEDESISSDESAQDDYYNDYDDDMYDEDKEAQETESDIYEAFDNPYIVQVAYDLSRNDLDEINRRNLDEDGFNEYVDEYVLGNYFASGFLALSAVGEFVLIDRFEQAISQLERDECYSPNLAMWLFNVTRARLPEPEDIVIDKWLNSKIERNDNQRQAVYKMLAAPDLCLIQGPPGTGKTTVIAEAIYQFVRKGYRVLLASQSNDAVDNALERLADTPEIRAIRLGQKGKRRRRNDDLSTRKFSEDEALKYYYNALSLQVSRNWLDKWDGLESGGEQYDIDIRDAKLFNQDIHELNEDLSVRNKQYEAARSEYDSLNDEFAKTNEHNTAMENDKVQFSLLQENFNGTSEEPYYLSEDMIRIFEEALNPLVKVAISQGVNMTPGILGGSGMGAKSESAYIALTIKNINTLKALREKIQSAKGEADESAGEAILLQREIEDTKQKMLDCMDSDDADGESKYRKIYQELRKKKDEISFATSAITISNVERGILSVDLVTQISDGNFDTACPVLEQVIEEWQAAVKGAIDIIGAKLSREETVGISKITERISIVEGRIAALKEEMQKIKEQIVIKRRTLVMLREKYEIEATKVDEIIEHIEKLKEENLRLLEEQKGFRDDWEKTLRSFKERLDDTDAFKHDQEHYQRIYVNACNIVGISCTDNMRNLTDNGYDDFDIVIIDEVSKATPPELLIPLMKARKAILVGDHRQLPPMFKEHEGSYKELIQNQENVPEEIKDLLTEANFRRFKKMVTSSLFKEYFEQADERIKHSLLVQYRMHSDIMGIINRFYEGRLSTGLTPEEERMDKNHGLTIKGVDGSTFIVPDRHAYWIDSSALPSGKLIYETFLNRSTSACNILEKYIVMELLKKIAKAYREQGYSKDNRKFIGVISFYQMQVNELKETFREVRRQFDFSAVDVDINTVDRFQGKEKNIIITSLVRNNKEAKASSHVVAFERINVAFSRAQELLFIVGSKHMYENARIELPNMDMPGFRTAPVYKNIMDDLNRRAAFKTSDKLITPDIEKLVLQEYAENGGRK